MSVGKWSDKAIGRAKEYRIKILWHVKKSKKRY